MYFIHFAVNFIFIIILGGRGYTYLFLYSEIFQIILLNIYHPHDKSQNKKKKEK